MGYIATVHKYHNWTEADTHSVAGSNTITEKARTAYRGIVKAYDGSPTVIIHNCAKVHYNKAKALADAKKLIIQLKKTICTPPSSKRPTTSNSAPGTA